MLKADLHLHSKENPVDVLSYSAEELIDQMAKLRYNVISITNHEIVYYNKRIADYAKEKGILLIPGVEFNIEGKHVVVINTETSNVKTFDDLRELKKREDVFIIAPHPFYPKMTSLFSRLLKNIDVFDAIEYSYLYLKWFNAFNKRAVKIARKHNLPLIGVSDCHGFSQLDHTYTLIDSKMNITDVMDALKSRRFKVETKPVPLTTFISMSMRSLKHIFNKR